MAGGQEGADSPLAPSVDGLGVDQFFLGRGTFADLDTARFQRFGHFADEVDVQHTVLVGRTDSADVIGDVWEMLVEGSIAYEFDVWDATRT